MKKQLIRRNVFETNSSSCHSMTFSPVDKIDEVEKSRFKSLLEGNVDVYNQFVYKLNYTFGWEIETHTDTVSKFEYICLLVFVYSYNSEYDAAKDIIISYMQQLLGVDDVNILVGDGYVDHGSDYLYFLDDIKTHDDLENFLFNSNNYIQTDNDNY